MAVETDIVKVIDISGKGRGVIACVDIAAGTLLLCEKPLFTNTLTGYGGSKDLEAFFAAKLKSLTKEQQRRFLTLHNAHPNMPPFAGTFKTNALPCGSGSMVGGVYPTICRINHSCLPNAQNTWHEDRRHLTIYAIRPIKLGDEITIPYHEGGPKARRQADLQINFGFKCTCELCSLPLVNQSESDARQRKIKQLDIRIGDPRRMMQTPQESLTDCRVLLETLDREYRGQAGVLNARAYYDALQIAIAHGDQARASVFAHRAQVARVLSEGPESVEARRMLQFAQRPSSHRGYGAASMKWRTSKDSVPEGLNAAELEDWLFRANK